MKLKYTEPKLKPIFINHNSIILNISADLYYEGDIDGYIDTGEY